MFSCFRKEAQAMKLLPDDGDGKKAVKGTVVLMKKNVLDLNDFTSAAADRVDELLGKRVSLQLISSVTGDPVSVSSGSVSRGKIGSPAFLENWNKKPTSITIGESVFKVTFDWDEEVGVPEAFIIKNLHHNEFYLKTLTLENVPGYDHQIHFVCNSWVYPADNYDYDRVFFSNQAYLPKDTPKALQLYREQELAHLQGDGTGERKEWDRIYDYDYYNDLGDPDKHDESYVRPLLGGSADYPYPRRGRTGRPPTKTDPKSESRLPLTSSLNIYVPRDERFGHLKLSDFLGYGLKSIAQLLLSEIHGIANRTPKEFDSFEDVLKIYEGGVKLPQGIGKNVPEIIKAFFPTDGEGLFRYPLPAVIKDNKTAWRTDEEFAREMLAGLNPVIITGLQEFPPTSTLDPQVYGNQTSTITKDHIKKNLDALTVDEAIEKNRLFILNHHDSLMPYLRRLNATAAKVYASRTLLFLQNDGTLKPLAIELSLPNPDGDELGPVSKVYTPSSGQGVEDSIWQLAKAYVTVNDSGILELITHWLRTHAVIEPIIISSNRQLSVLHPIHKLLHPHFRETMHINAIARQILINAKGVVESTLFPSKYAMEMSSFIYKDWVFPEQALPADLIKRKVAVEDPNSPHGVRLLIEDYPFAVDGLKIWSAIKEWVTDYCKFYYRSDEMIGEDTELQLWWKDVRDKGHGDKKDEPWWPQMTTISELIDSCTIIIWLSSALHAATNFGQWPYAGYILNRPTTSRRLMPELGSPEYEELKTDPEKVYLKTITAQLETLLGLSIIEVLSRHSSDEVYLGQRENPEWTKDSQALEAFQRFGKTLSEIEGEIESMNVDAKWRNRVGPVKVPYTLLFPTSEVGITGKGIPNSIVI